MDNSYYDPNLSEKIILERISYREEMNNLLGDISPYWLSTTYDEDSEDEINNNNDEYSEDDEDNYNNNAEFY